MLYFIVAVVFFLIAITIGTFVAVLNSKKNTYSNENLWEAISVIFAGSLVVGVFWPFTVPALVVVGGMYIVIKNFGNTK